MRVQRNLNLLTFQSKIHRRSSHAPEMLGWHRSGKIGRTNAGRDLPKPITFLGNKMSPSASWSDFARDLIQNGQPVSQVRGSRLVGSAGTRDGASEGALAVCGIQL